MADMKSRRVTLMIVTVFAVLVFLSCPLVALFSNYISAQSIEQHYLELGPLDEAADVSEWDTILEAYSRNNDQPSPWKDVICDSHPCEGSVF